MRITSVAVFYGVLSWAYSCSTCTLCLFLIFRWAFFMRGWLFRGGPPASLVRGQTGSVNCALNPFPCRERSVRLLPDVFVYLRLDRCLQKLSQKLSQKLNCSGIVVWLVFAWLFRLQMYMFMECSDELSQSLSGEGLCLLLLALLLLLPPQLLCAVYLGAVQTKVSSHLCWLLGLLRECH